MNSKLTNLNKREPILILLLCLSCSSAADCVVVLFLLLLFPAFRLDNFSIYGSNKTFNPNEDEDKQHCLNFYGTFGAGATRTLECDKPITARFLNLLLNVNKIIKWVDFSFSLLTFYHCMSFTFSKL